MNAEEVTFTVAPGGRVVRDERSGAAAAMRHLPGSAAGFHPATGVGGRVELHDAAGRSWGIFASEQLARQTAEALSR